MEPFSKNPWEIKLSREVLCAQGILNEVSKSACRWTGKARMGLLVGILVSSPVAMTRYFARNNLRVYLGLQVLENIAYPGGRSMVGCRSMAGGCPSPHMLVDKKHGACEHARSRLGL